MNFITIDFETATAQRDSPCEIGLTFVEDSKIVETKSWLIKPWYKQFYSFNVMLHGISEKDVKDAPTFKQLWPELNKVLSGNLLIAHNASFDMSVLRSTLELYKIPFPKIDYACSCNFSKSVWPGLASYNLKSLCHINDISFRHHRAGPDSLATAELSLKAFSLAEITSKEDFPIKLYSSIGQIHPEGYYTPSRRLPKEKRDYSGRKVIEIIGDPSKHNVESIFYGKSVVFTGKLMSMERKDAQQIIADIGGINNKTVTTTTDFLIVGQQEFRYVGETGMSRKQIDALKWVEKGSTIEVLSEEDFLNNL